WVPGTVEGIEIRNPGEDVDLIRVQTGPGVVIPVHPLNLRLTLALLEGLYRPTINPGPKPIPEKGARVLVGMANNRLYVRRARGDEKLIGYPHTVLLSRARPVGELIEGVLLDVDQPAPRTQSGWEMKRNIPGLWRISELAGTPGTFYVQSAINSPYPLRNPNTVRINRRTAAVTPDVLFDAEGRRYDAHYEVVEAAMDGTTLAPSHLPTDLRTWTPGYPQEFQTRDLGSPQESRKIHAIALSLDPERLLGRNLDATMGAPVVWEGPDGRLFVVAGNGRALAVLLSPEDKYEAYVKEGKRLWSCWPSEPARPGHRWVLVRVVRSIDQGQATRLAAASQLSTSAEEGRIARALGLVRSLGLDMTTLPPLTEWTKPIDSISVQAFRHENKAFSQFILNQMDPAKRAVYEGDDELMARLFESVMIGFLPPGIQRGGLFSDPKVEDALLGALPGLATISSEVQAGHIFPAFDLLTALPEAISVFRYLRQHRLSFKQLAQILDIELSTVRLGDVERLADTSDLALALAAALKNAAGRSAPAVVMAKYLRGYYDAVKVFDPAQMGMFGPPRPDAAKVLAALVPGFSLPRRLGARRNPAPGASRVRWLEFDRSVFKIGSDARLWAKAHRYKAKVPQIKGGVFRIRQDEAPSPTRGRRVPIGEGVVAVVG
ncbi:MAG: hypothetical protein V3U11_03130, partial [Planctomycetota bacterium]